MNQTIPNIDMAAESIRNPLHTIRHLFIFLHIGTEHRLLSKCLFSLAAILTLFLLLHEPAEAKSTHHVFMYKNKDIGNKTAQFSLKDQIVVRIKIENLPQGAYTFHADWYNAMGELQDTSTYKFTTARTGHRVLESHLAIKKASPLKKLFSASEATGYNIKFYGKWQVKLYLNGEEIAYKEFEVH